jgi:hypothetical protein
VCIRRGREKSAFHAIVDDEEGGGRGGRAEEDGGEACVYAADCLAEGEVGCCCGCRAGVSGFLEAGFDGVERVEGAVNR